MFGIISRGRLAAVAAAALLAGAAASAPAPAAAAPRAAEFGCNPSFESCFAIYTYYSSAAKTTVVGHANRDCDNTYTLDDGVETAYYTIRYFYCPT